MLASALNLQLGLQARLLPSLDKVKYKQHKLLAYCLPLVPCPPCIAGLAPVELILVKLCVSPLLSCKVLQSIGPCCSLLSLLNLTQILCILDHQNFTLPLKRLKSILVYSSSLICQSYVDQ